MSKARNTRYLDPTYAHVVRPILLCLTLWSVLMSTAGLLLAGVVTVDPDTPGSVTCGLQEAIDSLPPDGGEVFVPTGVYEAHATIYLKPDTTLRGQGAGSIIRKSPGLRILLSEDVSGTSTQDFVTVEDTSALRPGMSFLLGDLKRADSHVFIARTDGNRVYLHKGAGNMGKSFFYRSVQAGRPWKPSGDLKVENSAALYNGFMLVLVRQRCVIANLALDGNRDAQAVDGKDWYKEYPKWWERLRCAPYLGGDSRIEHCRIYGAAGVGVSLGNRATVFDCDIGHNWQGIHPGAGPYSRIIQNTIHHNNTKGIMLCLGNYGLIISQNHIYENQEAGIGELGVPHTKPGRDGDHFTIISDNVIYRNQHAGIESGQGEYGPEDFVITGNIVMNNWQCRTRYYGPHQFPAGISLFNAKRCVISNNRCFDDQDWHKPALTEDVAAGATNFGKLVDSQFPDGYFTVPMTLEPLHPTHYYDGSSRDGRHMGWGFGEFVARIQGGGKAEIVNVTHHGGGVVTPNTPLKNAYPAGAVIVPQKSQSWGIFVGGPESAGNVIMGNVCSDNAVGGVLWDGNDMSVQGNVGMVNAMNEARTLAENAHPFTNVPLPGLDFGPESGWSEGATFEPSDRSDGLMLKFHHADDKMFSNVVYNGARDPDVFPMRPNTFYRVTAWVKTDARQGDGLVLPRVFIQEHREDGSGASIGYAETRYPARTVGFVRPEVTSDTWLRVSGEGRTGSEAVAGQVFCRLARGATGTAWVDQVTVQMLEQGGELPAPQPELGAALRRATDTEVEQREPGSAGFHRADGSPAQLQTEVRASWDKDTVYIDVHCWAPDREALEKRRIAARPGFRFSDDCVAVLLRPSAANPLTYYQFAVSANGGTFSQACGNGARETKQFKPEWQGAAVLTPEGWSATVAIPFRELTASPPTRGTTWGLNIGRSGFTADGRRELSSWRPTANWHNTDAFGALTFNSSG